MHSKLIIFINFLLFSSICFSQHISFNAIDSVFADSSRVISKFYHYNIENETDSSFTMSCDFSKLESTREYVINRNSWQPVGVWKYYNRKGQLIKEIAYDQNSHREKYLNQWDNSGKQILKNGNGFYYKIDFLNGDSTVYEIKDSVKQSFTVWRKNKNYYIFKKVSYGNKLSDSKVISFYENGSILSTYEKKRFMHHGSYMKFYKNKVLAESGYYKNGEKIDNWKYRDFNGNIYKDCNYLNGRLFGEFKEYHKNGTIKTQGNYVHISGKKEVLVEDSVTFEMKTEFHTFNNIPAKHGKWFYYNDNKEIIKIESYIEGKKQ